MQRELMVTFDKIKTESLHKRLTRCLVKNVGWDSKFELLTADIGFSRSSEICLFLPFTLTVKYLGFLEITSKGPSKVA